MSTRGLVALGLQQLLGEVEVRVGVVALADAGDGQPEDGGREALARHEGGRAYPSIRTVTSRKNRAAWPRSRTSMRSSAEWMSGAVSMAVMWRCGKNP